MWNLRFIFLIFNLDLEQKLSFESALRVILVSSTVASSTVASSTVASSTVASSSVLLLLWGRGLY